MLVLPGFVFGSIPRASQGHTEPSGENSFNCLGHAFKVVKKSLSRSIKNLLERKEPEHTPEKGINTRTFQRVKPTHTVGFTNLLNKVNEESSIYDESGYLQPLSLRQNTTSEPVPHQVEDPIYATIDETAIRTDTKPDHLAKDIPPPLPPRNKAPMLDNGIYLHPFTQQNIYTEISDSKRTYDEEGYLQPISLRNPYDEDGYLKPVFNQVKEPVYASIDETAIRTNTPPDNPKKDIPPPLPPRNKAPILDNERYLHPFTRQNTYTEIKDNSSAIDDSNYASIDDLALNSKASPGNLAQEAPPLPPRNSMHANSKKKHPVLDKIKLISSAIGQRFKLLLKRQPQVDIITQGPESKVFKRVSPKNINMPKTNPDALN